jgi:hypothetical protein
MSIRRLDIGTARRARAFSKRVPLLLPVLRVYRGSVSDTTRLKCGAVLARTRICRADLNHWSQSLLIASYRQLCSRSRIVGKCLDTDLQVMCESD